MAETTLVPIALLYTRGRERIEGATRFQKLVFLLQEETELPENYTYDADQFGPYSTKLATSIESLIANGYIERNTWENEVGHPKHVYALTTRGLRLAKQMLKKDDFDTLFDESLRVKRKYNDWNLDRLLRYVYQSYPNYTTETELDLDRLYDPEARSEFLEPELNGEEVNSEWRDYLVEPDVFENDIGGWTARDLELGFTAQGDTETEALNNLGQVIAAVEGEAGHEPTDGEIEALGVDPADARDSSVESVPEFLL